MITLKEIVNSNLEMLKEQEASLEQSLSFVRKAIALFSGQEETSAKPARKRGRKPGVKVAKAAKRGGAPKTRNRKGGKHIDHILAILKSKNAPMSSSELIEALFKQQSKDKNLKHFGTLIYPVLTKAYKSKVLKLKDGRIHLAA
ncbi:MAG: hypothetical protein K1X63_12335 [Chitinophagales bacterium]|nr:hypothetical protein [Chitinophagales bacterium]